jgi:hypothetical protein
VPSTTRSAPIRSTDRGPSRAQEARRASGDRRHRPPALRRARLRRCHRRRDRGRRRRLREDETKSPETGAAASIKLPSPSPEGVIHDARDRRDVSPEGIEVSGLTATSADSDLAVGDSIEVEFTLRNVGSSPVTLDDAFVGVRTPDDENGDFGNTSEGAVLKPDQVLTINGTRVFDASGVWRIFPCYALVTGGESRFCPDEWRAFQVLVGD